MREKLDAMLRPSGKWTDIFIVAAILAVLMVLLGEVVMNPLRSGLVSLLELLTGSEGVAEFLYSYFAFFGIWVTFFPFCGLVKWNHPILKQLPPNKTGNCLRWALVGLLLGFGTNGFCILMSVLMGDIHLYFYEFDPFLFCAFLLAVCIQSAAEELVVRVYFYQKLRRRYRNPAVAVVGNALLFSAMHLFNVGITVWSVLSLILSGVTLALLIYYYDSLWAAITFHTAWNFTQNILFGLPNSGIVSEYSLFKLDAAAAEDGLFYTVIFGVEGSVGALLVLGLVIAALLILNRGKPEKNDLWGEKSPRPKEQAV